MHLDEYKNKIKIETINKKKVTRNKQHLSYLRNTIKWKVDNIFSTFVKPIHKLFHFWGNIKNAISTQNAPVTSPERQLQKIFAKTEE